MHDNQWRNDHRSRRVVDVTRGDGNDRASGEREAGESDSDQGFHRALLEGCDVGITDLASPALRPVCNEGCQMGGEG